MQSFPIETLSCIEIEPNQPAKKTIIVLHGLGADGSDFVPVVSELHLPTSAAVRFVFPHAPVMPITINSGFEMRAWYDILSLEIDRRVDTEGIHKSIQLVESLIQNEEKRGITRDNIVLAGFSQGAVIALAKELTASKPVAGVIALSGYLAFSSNDLQHVNRQLPIFLGHGTEDPIVPYALGKAAYVTLQQLGCHVNWHSYRMAHSVCAEEINDIRDWLLDLWK